MRSVDITKHYWLLELRGPDEAVWGNSESWYARCKRKVKRIILEATIGWIVIINWYTRGRIKRISLDQSIIITRSENHFWPRNQSVRPAHRGRRLNASLNDDRPRKRSKSIGWRNKECGLRINWIHCRKGRRWIIIYLTNTEIRLTNRTRRSKTVAITITNLASRSRLTIIITSKPAGVKFR